MTSPDAPPAGIPRWLREILRCPMGRHVLVDAEGPDGQPELHCAVDCGAPGRRHAFRVEDGIPVLLADEARRFSFDGSTVPVERVGPEGSEAAASPGEGL